MAPTTILGIDPGTNILGYGVIAVDAAGKPSFIDMGVLDLRRISSPYDKLECIYSKVSALCDLHHPSDLAIESPFYGKNAQVVLKLGRAQGAAMIAAMEYGITDVHEYAPREAKQAITGNGAASKEQVSLILEKTLGFNLAAEHLDATDALAIAMCHYYASSSPLARVKGKSSWENFIKNNPDRVK